MTWIFIILIIGSLILTKGFFVLELLEALIESFFD